MQYLQLKISCPGTKQEASFESDNSNELDSWKLRKLLQT